MYKRTDGMSDHVNYRVNYEVVKMLSYEAYKLWRFMFQYDADDVTGDKVKSHRIHLDQMAIVFLGVQCAGELSHRVASKVLHPLPLSQKFRRNVNTPIIDRMAIDLLLEYVNKYPKLNRRWRNSQKLCEAMVKHWQSAISRD